MSRSLILYDGVCGLCNKLTTFVLKRDHADHFVFASLQSSLAHQALEKYGKDPEDLNTLYVLTDYGESGEALWSRSGAAIQVLSRLGTHWQVASRLLKIFPAAIRDAFYKLIASSRYRIFGKYDACPAPRKEWRAKFLQDE